MLPVLQSSELKPKEQPLAKQLEHNGQVWQATTSGTGAASTTAALDGGQASDTGGGAGSAPAPSEPGIMMSGAAGVVMVTPESVTLNAKQTTAIVAGHDINPNISSE
jgi:uncharacterized protein (DUF2345 family)